MSVAERVFMAALLAALAGPATARECGEGQVRGGMSAAGDALQHYDCAMLARIYCRIAEDRDIGIGAEESVRRSGEWLASLNQTGSRTRPHWEPVLKIAAGEVYRNRQRAPGPTYYRAAYACGLSLRVGDDGAARQRAGKAFDAAADRCEREHALPATRSFPNPPLRECLANAVDRLTSGKP